jgi:hypothetical protein
MELSSVQFVERVWQELAATGPTDFARKLGLGPDGLQKVRRWRAGGRLDYEDVMQMLELCGWLSIGGDAQSAWVAPADPLAALAVAVGELALTQAAIADALGVERAAVELPRARQSQRPGTPKRRRAG